MKKIIFLLTILFSLNLPVAFALDWDLLNEDCADISDWVDWDDPPCETTEVTFKGQSCCKFYAPSTADDDDYAGRYITLASIPDTFTLEARVYIDSFNSYQGLYLGLTTDSDDDGYSIWIYGDWTYEGEEFGNEVFVTTLGELDVIAVRVGADALLDTWFTIRLVVKTGKKMDLWINDRCYFANVTHTRNYEPDANDVTIYIPSDATTDATMYVDWIRLDTTPEAQTSTSALQIHDQQIVVHHVQEGGTDPYENPYLSMEPLRIQAKKFKGASPTVCGIPLVATTDTNASSVRFYDGSTTKALMKLPD